MRRRMIRKFVRGCLAGNGPPATPEAPAAWEAGRGASRSLLFFFRHGALTAVGSRLSKIFRRAKRQRRVDGLGASVKEQSGV